MHFPFTGSMNFRLQINWQLLLLMNVSIAHVLILNVSLENWYWVSGKYLGSQRNIREISLWNLAETMRQCNSQYCSKIVFFLCNPQILTQIIAKWIIFFVLTKSSCQIWVILHSSDVAVLYIYFYRLTFGGNVTLSACSKVIFFIFSQIWVAKLHIWAYFPVIVGIQFLYNISKICNHDLLYLHGLTLRILKKKIFLKDHLRKSKVNSRFLSKYKEILIYKWRDKSNLNIYLSSNFILLRKDVMKKKKKIQPN